MVRGFAEHTLGKEYSGLSLSNLLPNNSTSAKYSVNNLKYVYLKLVDSETIWKGVSPALTRMTKVGVKYVAHKRSGKADARTVSEAQQQNKIWVKGPLISVTPPHDEVYFGREAYTMSAARCNCLHGHCFGDGEILSVGVIEPATVGPPSLERDKFLKEANG